MADQKTICPSCGRDRAKREPHKPGCLPKGMTKEEVRAVFKPLPPEEVELLREYGP